MSDENNQDPNDDQQNSEIRDSRGINKILNETPFISPKKVKLIFTIAIIMLLLSGFYGVSTLLEAIDIMASDTGNKIELPEIRFMLPMNFFAVLLLCIVWLKTIQTGYNINFLLIVGCMVIYIPSMLLGGLYIEHKFEAEATKHNYVHCASQDYYVAIGSNRGSDRYTIWLPKEQCTDDKQE